MFKFKFKNFSEICPDSIFENDRFSKADSYKIAKPDLLKTSPDRSLLNELNLIVTDSPRIESSQFQRLNSIASSLGSFAANENPGVPIAQQSFSVKSRRASENHSSFQNNARENSQLTQTDSHNSRKILMNLASIYDCTIPKKNCLELNEFKENQKSVFSNALLKNDGKKRNEKKSKKSVEKEKSRKKQKKQELLDLLEKSPNRMFLLQISEEAERNSKMPLKKSIFNFKKRNPKIDFDLFYTLKIKNNEKKDKSLKKRTENIFAIGKRIRQKKELKEENTILDLKTDTESGSTFRKNIKTEQFSFFKIKQQKITKSQKKIEIQDLKNSSLRKNNSKIICEEMKAESSLVFLKIQRELRELMVQKKGFLKTIEKLKEKIKEIKKPEMGFCEKNKSVAFCDFIKKTNTKNSGLISLDFQNKGKAFNGNSVDLHARQNKSFRLTRRGKNVLNSLQRNTFWTNDSSEKPQNRVSRLTIGNNSGPGKSNEFSRGRIFEVKRKKSPFFIIGNFNNKSSNV